MRLQTLFHPTCLTYSQPISVQPLPFIFEWPRSWPAVKVKVCKEQHSDPEISPLFERALEENDISQIPVCYYVKNGILMRKWRPPDVSAEDEWTVNHQIVVPRVYRPEILNLVYEIPMSDHLGVNKTYHKILNHFTGQG